MTASARTWSRRSAAEVMRGLDALLPADVGVLAVTEVPLAWHALRDARWKWYRYTWFLSRTRRVALRANAWRVEPSLDVDALREAGARLPGRRDFACFQSSGSPRVSTVRCLAGLVLETEGPLLHLDVAADGFLYGMVRAIAGTLTEVGRGRRAASSLDDLLASGDRRRAGAAAPAHGLSLRRVGYPGDPWPAFVDPSLRADLESGGPARLDTTPPVGGPGP
jgi:tRNA pseudouridine38-40 synthase